MAYLLPANLANNMEVPRPLRQAAEVFRDWLPEQVTVTLYADSETRTGSDEVPLAGSLDSKNKPYLVVLHPKLGVVFLDFVPGSTVRALGSNRRSRAVLRRLAEETSERLGRQSDEVRGRLAAQGLTDESVPVALALAAPGLTRAKALAGGRFDVDQFLLRDDLTSASIEAALRRVVTHARGGRPHQGANLSAVDERRVRAAINPQLIVHREMPPEQGQLVFRPPDGGEDVVRVLDRRQERLADHLGSGYRVIKGVAGSGKTLVLTFRARHLAHHHPRWRILLTCFNRPLASSLAPQFDGLPQVEVRTVDGIANQICTEMRIRTDHLGNGKYDRRVQEVLQAIDAGHVPERFHYDVVLVDEAQDLDKSRTQMLFGLLKQPWNDFVIALDSAQNLYRRQPGLPPPAQHPPGSTDTTEISGRGRTEVLRLNYRNTYQILKFADDFLRADGLPEGGDPADPATYEDPATYIPPEAAERTGPEPDVRSFALHHSGYQAIGEALCRSHDEGIRWSDMSVLAGNWDALNDFERSAREHGIPIFKLADLDSRSGAPEDGVRLSTLQHAKGLEFARVYIVGVDDIRGGPDTDVTLQRRLLYVGMTRATDVLKIAVSGEDAIVDSLLEAR